MRFKKPKMHANEGSLRARMIRTAQSIRTQEQLDRILTEAGPQVGAAWLEIVRPFLKVQPRDIEPTN